MSLLGLLMILPPRIKRHSTVVFFNDDDGTKYDTYCPQMGFLPWRNRLVPQLGNGVSGNREIV
jgi:hypothetical protein